MAHHIVGVKSISIRLACQCLHISETCYRYQAKSVAENQQIADRLLQLTQPAINAEDLGYAFPIYVISKDGAGTINSSIVFTANVN